MMFKADQAMTLLKKPGISADDMYNERPITNLITIRKIPEYLAMKQIQCHMESMENIALMQSAY